MSKLTSVRLAGAAALLVSVPLVASAQTQSPSSPTPPSPPAATRPDTTPMPAPSTRPTTPPRTTDKSATSQDKINPLVGLAVFSADGTKMGSVHSVNAEPDGKVKAIHVKTGGFLGIGGKLVAIPDGKFARAGDNIQLGMTAEEVSKLPEVKGQS